MKNISVFFLFFLFCFFIFSSVNVFATEIEIKDDNNSSLIEQTKKIQPRNTLYLELKDGVVVVELFPSIAPRHVERIRSLVRDGFYDGLKFHRVISGFMAQTGDPTGTGRGGSQYGNLYAEFNNEHHTKGTLSMARASDVNSANSQFFIVTGEFFPELDNNYTIFGRVINGMNYVENIKPGDTANNGIVKDPDIIVKAVTGDMLNNKSYSVVLNEIKLVENIQKEEKQKDPKYVRKSILKLLLRTRDLNNQTDDLQKEGEFDDVYESEENINENIEQNQNTNNSVSTYNVRSNVNR